VSGTDVQRSIRRMRAIRVAAFFAVALNAFILAANVVWGSLLLASVSAACVIALLALVVAQTRMLGTLRQRERELSRPRMTAEDYRRLRELEAELGWELTATPADVADYRRLREMEIGLGWEPGDPPEPARPSLPVACECGKCDGSHEGPAMRWFRDTRRPDPVQGEPPAPAAGAPMTGPGGAWRPVSELFERDARAAEHFAGLDRAGRESCIDPCPFCAERDARSETMRQWLEDERWEQ
jgi:hypothetical protein